jgi:hypothetical protein
MKNALGESSWWLIEKDSDRKIFTVIGPIFDDTKYIEKSCLVQRQGKNITISTVDSKKNTKPKLIDEFRQMLKYEYVEYDILEN